MKFVGVVVLLAWIKVTLSQQCTEVCPTDSGVGWNSNLRVVESSPTYVVVEWDQDMPGTLYQVRYQPRDSQSIQLSTTNITQLSYNITGLLSDTAYDVIVCRATSQDPMDDCGNCILCVTTPPPPAGPPDPPPNFRIQVDGPETLSLAWDATVGPNITAFIVLCVDTSTGMAALNVSQIGRDNTPVTGITQFGFTPDTTYNCSVAAVSPLGMGPFSPVVQATTPPRTSGPAILLMTFNTSVEFSQITEETVDEEITYVNNRAVLISDASRALGIDYHYYREELYFATDNKAIVRVNVSLDTDNSGDLTIALTQANGSPEEVLLSGLPGDSLGSVTVDWIYDEIYWIEYTGAGSRVRRAVLNNGGLDGPFCVAEFSGRIRHIIVDPVHGYFNWNDEMGLYRAPISSVRVNNVDCPTPDVITGRETLLAGNIVLFTFEADQIYLFREFECFSNFNYTISVANLDGQGLRDFIPSEGASFPSLASYTQRVIVPDPSLNDMPVVPVENAVQCPASLSDITTNFIAPDVVPNLVRTLIDTQQPLPAPTFSVSDVRVLPSDTSVLVSWSAPVFTGTLFSSSAYDDWVYIVEYRPLGEGQWSTSQTSDLSLTITGLDPGVLYEFDVVAQGLSGAAGETRLDSPLVFTTITQANIELVVATPTGVIRTDFAGQNPRCVGQDNQGSIGVAYDSYSDTTYWAIGNSMNIGNNMDSQGQIVEYTGSDNPTILVDQVSNPFSLRLDWVTRRLFWVQDGATLGSSAIMYASVDGPEAAGVFQQSSSTANIETTAMDALNGMLFWVSDTTINRKTLSGVEYPTPCHVAATAPTALTVDPERQLLYWLSNTVSNGPLTINQLEYNTTDCMQTIQARELTGTGISFSSSATMTYASDTLFIASQTSSVVFAMPSNYMEVPIGRTFAVSSLQVSSVCIAALPVTIQDIAITSSSVQPLPTGLAPRQRGLTVVTPSQAPSAPVGDGSTSDTIMISWDPVLPVLPDSPLLYLVNYQLNLDSEQQAPVITGTSLVLTNQQPSTTVTSSVTACSLWQCGEPSANSTFESLPALPGVVRNVRVYLYRPVAGQNNFSALVLWDPPLNSVVTRYYMFIQQSGVDVPNVYQPPGSDTSHMLLQRDPVDFSVTYFIAADTSYTVEILAENPSGNGTSSLSTPFIASGPNYPRQVLVLEPSGVGVAGEEPGIVTTPTSSFIQPSRPFVVDTITREVFFAYFSTEANSYTIFKNSLLQGGSDDPLKLMDPGIELLDLAYDWIARELYYAVRTSSNNLEFHKVFVLNRNANVRLFPDLVHTLPSSVSLQLTVDPMGGFLYWQQLDSSTLQLHSLNLRQNDATSSTVLSTTTSRRKRQSTDSLASLNLSPVLAQDPVSGTLLVATTSGDIYSCNVTADQCQIAVNGSALAVDPSTIALPPTHIAVDGGHIYWSNEGQAGVYAVERENPSSLITISTDTVSALFGLSPESQPLVSQMCLSPNFANRLMRPVVTVTGTTNTTASLEWTESRLLPECADVVFSFPPLTYTVGVANPEVDLFTFVPVGSTFAREFTIEGLDPFTLYSVNLMSMNLYSMRRGTTDTFEGRDEEAMTLEGVPEPPMNLQFRVFGTSSVQLSWDTGDPRGPPESVTFYVRSASGQETKFTNNITSVNSSNGIEPGLTQFVQVFTSNQVFNSTLIGALIPFWELAPAPVVPDVSNTSLNVSIELRMPAHNDIMAVAVQVCVHPGSTIGASCDCSATRNDTDFQDRGVSNIFEFSLDALTAFTYYCVQSVGRYRVELAGTEPEVTSGVGTVMMTDEGIPDVPRNVRVVDSELRWEDPVPRSVEGVRSYLITATAVLEGLNSTLEVVRSPVNLQTSDELGLTVNLLYDIKVQAINDIGTGPPSLADQQFRRTPVTGVVLDAPAIAGIAVSATILVALCLCFVLFCVWFIRLGRPKEQEIRSLSYMYGPDHELSNLRSAFRQTQSQNPHYTWCREDYVCTDEDLDLLSKFPRHNLKLENFIDRGEFGEVYQGTAIDILGTDTGPTPVAVKTLRKGAGIEDQRKFLSEASLMSNFNHPNIVKVLGVCLDNDPVYIIMELMPAGDLLKFLRDAKRDHGPALLTLTEQVQVALDVAHGCRYLEQQHFIHRDIAARNCLVSSRGADRVVKIGDFGLARDLYSSDYYQVEGQRKLPVRWMAPEALLQGKFAVESDIWSFGVLLWEIMSLGNQPYPGRINQEVLQFVTGGGRLDKPEKCPSKLYHLMQNCWKRYASDRPHFDSIVTTLTNFLDRIKRPDSVYHSDTDSDSGDENLPKRQSSTKTPTRTPSFKSGFMNLARSGSIKLRNSFRRHGSIHKREENTISQLPEDGNSFRERGPF